MITLILLSPTSTDKSTTHDKHNQEEKEDKYTLFDQVQRLVQCYIYQRNTRLQENKQDYKGRHIFVI